MTIASFDHYTPLGSDPKLSRSYATKKDIEELQEKVVCLTRIVDELNNRMNEFQYSESESLFLLL